MNTKYKVIISILVILLVGYIGYKVYDAHLIAGAGSPVGTTNNTPRINQQVCNNVATTTYASFLNTDSNDRIIEGLEIVDLATTTSQFGNIGAGTSTGPAGTSTSPLYWSSTIATTSGVNYIAASLVGNGATAPTSTIVSNNNRVWLAGSYLNFIANSTTSDYCTIKVSYLPE